MNCSDVLRCRFHPRCCLSHIILLWRDSAHLAFSPLRLAGASPSRYRRRQRRRIQNAITPCTNYVSGSQLSGRETAAQWLRVAFREFSLFIVHAICTPDSQHAIYADDFVTADVEKGTGGIDASIGFETLRPENSGSAMNDSLAFFAPYVNAHTSSEYSLC